MPGLRRWAVQQGRHFLHRLLAWYHLFLGCFAMYRLPRRHVRVFVRTVCPLRIRQDDEWPYGADFLLDQEVLAGSSSQEWQMPELSRRAVQQGRHLLYRLLAWQHLFLWCFAMYRLPRRYVRVFLRAVRPLRLRQDDQWYDRPDFLFACQVR
jgi:hypothetical protein